jgi:glutaminyl-tRNA synthetase
MPQPRQYEFARLNLTYVVTSKRKLKHLVDSGRHRLGRPAHAHHRRPAPPRLHACVHPQLLRTHRRDQGLQLDRLRTLEGCLREDLEARPTAPWPCSTRSSWN